MHVQIEVPYLSRRQLDALADSVRDNGTELVMKAEVKEVDQARRTATIVCKPHSLKLKDVRSDRTLEDFLEPSHRRRPGSSDSDSPRPSPPRNFILEPRGYVGSRRRDERDSRDDRDENAAPSPFSEAFRRVFPGGPDLPR